MTMATKRNLSQEKSAVGRDDNGPFSPKAGEKSIIAPAVPTSVILKLLGFTFAMFALPISSYFLTVNTIFRGNSTYAGGLAAILANVVLVGYVIVAMKEDQSERLEAEEKAKKGQ
ncbi:VMA21-like domain-containing protein [Aulographum hederae CBS 113979]|uniref:VMA21-like domain-containing protein n=1 Tax=Aulographum hederae CBS 113979 TaxID=1176131 RepID=A0A6G1GK65_9PEZI|nr:VMA21-like domain-containing protein [Aulographum hederae CBS 113979]